MIDKRAMRILALEKESRVQQNEIKSLKRINKQLQDKIKHLDKIVDVGYELVQSKMNK